MAFEKIKNVKLRGDGLKGIVVSYEKPSTREDLNFRDEFNVSYKAPVSKELSAAFELLKPTLKKICQLDPKLSSEDIKITGVTSDASTMFVISAKIRTVNECWFAVNTPKIDESMNIPEFFSITEVIEEIYAEVRSYIRSDKKIDLKQLALDLVVTDKKTDIETVQAMSDEEKEAYAREILEANGAIVIMPDEISMDGSDSEEKDQDPEISEQGGEGDMPEPEESEQNPTAPVDVPGVEEPQPEFTGFGNIPNGPIVRSISDGPEPEKDPVSAEYSGFPRKSRKA